MNPISVRIFNMRSGKIVEHFLNMCETTSTTVEVIYTVLNYKISQLLNTSEPCHSCTSVGTNNTFANIGIQMSLKTRLIYCP